MTSAFLLIAAVFYVFTYNTGYGYDACEYLMIGRSLLDGFRISTFVLSKGWATYVMSASALALLPAWNHAWISCIITLLCMLAVAGSWWVGRDVFGKQTATLSALLIAACAFFMELNFLEPEIPVYLCGLLAVYFLEVATRLRPAVRLSLAGMCLGLGFAFKAVVLFYLAAIFCYLFFHSKKPRLESLRNMLWISAGFAAATAVPACYFAATGQLRHHILWSFLFPLLYYPSNTFWLRKLYTKLLWFFVLFGGVLLLSFTKRLRSRLFVNPRIWLFLWMGVLAMLSLLKTQSSHYVFPGAAFLSFFIAETLCCWWNLEPGRRRCPVWIPMAAIALMAVSAWLYSPPVFARLFHKRDYSAEDRLAAYLKSLTRPVDRVLFLRGGMLLYWLADRYPNVPLVSTDVQSTYLLFQQPEMLIRSLDDPNLKLVEFDPQHLDFDDPHFLASEHHRILIQRFSERLQERFRRIPEPEQPLSLWVRRQDQP